MGSAWRRGAHTKSCDALGHSCCARRCDPVRRHRPAPAPPGQSRYRLAAKQARGQSAWRILFRTESAVQAALDAIGFKVTGLSGRVRWMSPPDSPLGPREHMMLKVDLPDGPYLADVGFGACVLDSPLQFKTDAEQRTAMGTYRLSEADGLFSL